MPVTGVDGVSRLAVGMAGVDGRAGVDIAMSSPELLFLLGPPLRNQREIYYSLGRAFRERAST